MSLISLIATDKFISFMSDGRMSDGDEILSGNYKKITKVNDNIIIGIAGNLGASKILNENLHLYDQRNARSFAHSLFGELGNGVIHKEMHILVGGLDESNQIYYSGFSQFSTELIEINPIKYKPALNFATTAINVDCEISNQDRLKMLIENDFQNVLKLKGAKGIQEKLNAQVSMIDNSVNTKTFHEYVRK